MSQVLLSRSAIVALVAASLAACETSPKYPVSETAPGPSPIQPKYPISEPPPPVHQPAPPPPMVAAPPPPSPAPLAVTSQALPPVTQATGAAPATVAPSSLAPAAATPAPVRAPPPAAYRPPAYTPPVYTPPPAPVFRTLAGGRVVEARGMYRRYDVQRHDHVDAIARDLGTTRKVIVEANHLKAPFALRPGQELKVPVDKAYVAESGDTMSAVARRFDVSVGALADYNDLSSRERLRAGDRIALPPGFHDRGPIHERISPMMASRPSAPTTPARSYATIPPSQPYTPYTPPPSPYRPPVSPPPPSVAVVTQTPAQIVAIGQGRFVWPVRGDIISGFGAMGAGRRNDGVDVRSPLGSPVHAAAAGEVVYAGDQVPGFGNLVLVKHADGWVTAYAHLGQVAVHMRQPVVQGEEIGLVGETGGATEPQLHFEVRYAAQPTDRAKPIDPLLVLPK